MLSLLRRTKGGNSKSFSPRRNYGNRGCVTESEEVERERCLGPRCGRGSITEVEDQQRPKKTTAAVFPHGIVTGENNDEKSG